VDDQDCKLIFYGVPLFLGLDYGPLIRDYHVPQVILSFWSADKPLLVILSPEGQHIGGDISSPELPVETGYLLVICQEDGQGGSFSSFGL